MEIISNIALININETLIFQLISFFIFLFIINRVMFRPLQSVMGERDAFIENLKNDVIEAEKTMDELTLQLKERKAAAKTEALKLKKELEISGSKEAEDINLKAKDAIVNLKQSAQEDVDKKIDLAKKFIQNESKALSIQIMGKILDRRLGI